MSAAGVPIIGIVGGIGSGKTTLANALQKELRSCRLDADAAGHRALRTPQVRSQLTAIFGTGILDASGQISRPALAQLVFGPSAEQQAGRKQLEHVVHPTIERDLIYEIGEHRSAKDCDVLLLDAALMLEAGWSRMCDSIVYLDVPRHIRLQRVSERGWDEAELDRREASQMGLEEKRRQADFVLNQSGNISAAASQMAEWLRSRFPQLPQLTARAPSSA